ncbi:MAG: GMC family oxidoreductase [Elainellaceae cyanobacterium]
MLIDARRISAHETLETEVCIIGAGPAGIALARELMGQNFRVCLLETGGFEPDAEIQNLAAGEGDTIGDFYPGAIYMRTRQYGGTANQWSIDMGNQRPGVRYVTLDPIDFEKRDWVPYSGWPITKADLDPYYERAHTVCQTGPYDYDVASWEDEQAKRIPFKSDRLTTQMFHFGPRGVFTEDYRSELEQSQNVTLCIYATALELETDESANAVRKVRVGTLSGNEFWVAARYVILTLGGLETARLLLLSNKTQKTGLGNANDLVGRFLMDHPIIRSGKLLPADRQVIHSLKLYDARWTKGAMVIAKPVLSEETKRRERLLNMNMALFPRADIHKYSLLRTLLPQGRRYRSPAIESAQAVVKSLKHREFPDNLGGHLGNLIKGMDDLIYYQWRKKPRFDHQYGFDTGGWSQLDNLDKRFGCFETFHLTEQIPDPSNRVTLGVERDRLGCRKMQIHWRWGDQDMQSAKRSLEIFANEFAQAGLGTLKLELDRGVPQVFLPSIHHHMGTTRMHNDPKQGVVNADCQVHGVPNLFIASSSVFTTGGYANPTLTIVALAIRVADQVKAQMTQQSLVQQGGNSSV